MRFRVLSFCSDVRYSGTASFVERWTRPVTLKLPIHSIVAFVWGVLLTRDFDLIFSFLAFSVGWGLLATMEQAQKHPSPWNQPRSYTELLVALLLNKSYIRPHIGPNQNFDQIQEYKKTQETFQQAQAEVFQNIEMERKKFEELIAHESHDFEEETLDVSTKVGGGLSQITLAPFKSILLPAQLQMHKACVALRITKSIVTWRESCVAFWIVTTSFVVAIVLSLIPWAFLVSWGFKMLVWVFLGPWMKIVDIFYVTRRQI